jgi:hypothetical protein
MKSFDLNLLQHKDKLQFTNLEGLRSIFCQVRRKWLVVTPEEMVRQLLIIHLIEIGYAKNKMAVEKSLKVNGKDKRFDIVLVNSAGIPFILVECKAPGVTVNQEVFDQASRYNMVLHAPYLLISNGLETCFCQVNHTEKKYIFEDSIIQLSD